jgi:hypothetical protein
MQGAAWIFFVLFAAVLIGTYLSIRRGWASPGITAGVSIIMSITSMIMVSLAQGNPVIWAVIVGILVGGLFSGATLAVAWYFHSNELRAQQGGEVYEEAPQEE